MWPTKIKPLKKKKSEKDLRSKEISPKRERSHRVRVLSAQRRHRKQLSTQNYI